MAAILAFVISAPAQRSPFLDFVKKRISKEYRDKKDGRSIFDQMCPVNSDPFARRVFFEYGAVFVTTKDVRVPRTCIFRDRREVDDFQSNLEVKSFRFGNSEIELQEPAMERLIDAQDEAREVGLRISPLDGKIAGRRSYDDTVKVWNSRFYRALDYWVRRGKIRKVEADQTRFAPVPIQVSRIIEWERQGFFFSSDLSKSIFYSVAPPGTSQHLSMLAFDVVEAGNPAVRRILNKYGWYQTIRTDQPHFTFLGVEETELPARGLRNIFADGNSYWVPIPD
jgi:hypothetical protein